MSAAPATSRTLRKRGKASVRGLGIPAKLNAHSEGKPNGIPGRSRTPSERSDAGNSIVQEVFGFVKRNLSGAPRALNRTRPNASDSASPHAD